MPSYSRRANVPGKSAQELYDTVSKQIDHFMGKVTASDNYEIERDPENFEFHFKAKLFSGTLSCEDSSLDLKAKLSLIAVPFRSKIDEGIDHWLEKMFDSKNV